MTKNSQPDSGVDRSFSHPSQHANHTYEATARFGNGSRCPAIRQRRSSGWRRLAAAVIGAWVGLIGGVSGLRADTDEILSIAAPTVDVRSLIPDEAVAGAGDNQASHGQSTALPTPASSTAQKVRLQEGYGRLPMSFEPNVGQTAEEVKYLARGPGYTLFLTGQEAVLALRPSRPGERFDPEGPDGYDVLARPGLERLAHRNATRKQEETPGASDPAQEGEASESNGAVVRMRLSGPTHNPTPTISGLERLPGISNYFIGKDPHNWHTNIPNFSQVAYRDVYPGIDLVYYGNPGQLEYDFVLSPGADPSAIQIVFQGADSMRVTDDGDLVLKVNGGELVQRAPKIYEVIEGKPRPVDGRYVVLESERKATIAFASGTHAEGVRVGFRIAAISPSGTLVIDPVIDYSTFLGGTNTEYVSAIAVDRDGNAYVTGYTRSNDFPKVNPLYPFCGDLRTHSFSS